MEPSVNPEPSPAMGPEPAPQPERGDEQKGPETSPEKTVEREEVQPEHQQPGEGSTVLPPVQPPAGGQLSVPISPPADDSKDDTLPAVAEDVDVIEKEWVNKAKQLIEKTRNDPHAQEVAFEKLQKEYLKKRYGKEIKSSA